VNLPSIISAILALLALVAVVGSAVAVARVNLSKATIETLKASNDALSERVGILVEQGVTAEKRLAAVESENAVLRTLNNGAEAVNILGSTLSKSVEDARLDHRDILAVVEAIAMSFQESNTALHDRMDLIHQQIKERL
jgi:hypothetical protein